MACAETVIGLSSTGPAQVLSEWEDLASAGYSRSVFHEKYREIYSTEPECVSVNEGICMNHGHYCYTIQETCTFSEKQLSTIFGVGDSKEVVNNTSEPLTMQVELQSTQKSNAIVTVTQPSVFSFRDKVSVTARELGMHGVFSTGFSLDNQVNSTCSVSECVEVADSVCVTLQPGQRARATLDVSWIEMKKEFTVPFRIEGWCMASFADPVNGQRYWLHDIASLFETPRSCLTGTVECVDSIKGSTHVQFL